MKYLVVIEKATTGFSAYIPDFPGCIATGDTVDEVKELIRDALDFHIDGMREDGLEMPMPTSVGWEVEVEL